MINKWVICDTTTKKVVTRLNSPTAPSVSVGQVAILLPAALHTVSSDRYKLNDAGSALEERLDSDLLAQAKITKQDEVREKAREILYAKWPQWMRDNINRGMDPDLESLYDNDVTLIRSESGNVQLGTGFEGAIEALTTEAEVLAFEYTFTEI